MSRPLRFTFILALAAVATGLAAAGGWRYARASAPLSGPIVLVSIDTLRADHLPAYGYTGIRTPAIDALAADGVVFERAYSHSPQTLPAHASILSGRLPFENGVRDDVGFAVKASERLLPAMLRDRGYATGGVVSAYLLRKDTGIAQGFDFFDAVMPPEKDGEPVAIRRDGAAAEAAAEKWLDSMGSARAFLFLHINEPHAPYAAPERFSEGSPYDRTVAYTDEIVGRFVRYLKSHQLYDRSTIVLLSDHGEGLGDHGEKEHGLFLYDEALHVPLIIKQEGNAGAGRRVASPVQHIDLVPTILDLVKAPIPGNLRGRSLKPVLDGTGKLTAQPIYSEALYGRYHFGWSPLRAVTEDRYRYISATREELYDLQADPREQRNLAAERRDTRKGSAAALARFAASPLPVPAGIAPEIRERLQALGYFAVADAAAELPDPKDKREVIDTYRSAMQQAVERRWPESIALLQQTLREEPDAADVWRQLGEMAARLDRFDVAADAFRHYCELRPEDPEGYLRSAATLLRARKLDDARNQAAHAADVAADAHREAQTAAHELLARVALAKRDADAARSEAQLVHDADANSPLPAFVDARLLYDQGRFADALPLFEQALADQQKAGGVPIADLHVLAADTYNRLQRYDEAETQLLAELHDYPLNVRARGALASLYHATGRPEEAAAAIEALTAISPTPEAYALAARLWTTIGNREQAEAVRAASRERFPAPQRRSAAVR